MRSHNIGLNTLSLYSTLLVCKHEHGVSSPRPVSLLFFNRKRAERRAAVRGVVWRSLRISPTQMDLAGRVSTPTRSTTSACTVPAGSDLFCPKQPWGLKRSPGTPTPTPAPGELYPWKQKQEKNQSSPYLFLYLQKIWYTHIERYIIIPSLLTSVKYTNVIKD